MLFHRTTPNMFFPATCLATLAALLVASTHAAAQSAAFDAYLKASNTGADDHFGSAVAVSGDTLVIGAPQEDSGATGVNGAAFDESKPNAGAAYVYVRSGTTWVLQAYLKASNTGMGDLFGSAVAISGDTVVVGAPAEASVATGVNGDQLSNTAPSAGAAYVFVRNGTSWSQQAYLKASNTDLGDEFGGAVAISGETLVVGARFEDSAALGVNGDGSSDLLTNSGAAYVFTRVGSTWSQQAYLKPSSASLSDFFGSDVDLSGDLIVVGAPGEDSPATGVNGNGLPDTLSDAGAAFAFVRSAGVWSQQAYLKASNTGLGDRFGTSVGASDNTLVVGADNEESAATGVGGEQADDTALAAGAAYVFTRQLGAWSQQAYLKPSNTDPTDFFGSDVAVSGDLVLVGALSEDGGAVFVDGDDSSDSIPGSGAAYLFARTLDQWSQEAYLKASNTGLGDRFGLAVALQGDSAVVGADEESSDALGVGGNGADDSFPGAGAAYAYDVSEFAVEPWFDERSALAGLFGPPQLVGDGPMIPGSANGVQLTNAAPSAPAAITIAATGDGVPFKGGTLKPFPLVKILFTNTNLAGARTVPFVLPTGVPAGAELWVQFAVQDAAAVAGVSLSNALRGVAQ